MNHKKIQGREKILYKKKVQKLKEQGITLIALVVTIVLLLILVGVTISQITGENGLIRKAKEAVERYKNATEEEQIQLGQLEQYVSDFSIVGGYEGEEKALVSIEGLEAIGDKENKQIIVKLKVIGEVSKIEYSIDNGKIWITNKGEEKELEEKIEAEVEETKEYTYTFEGLELGKSYYVRVKVYDKNEKYVEAISDIVTLSNIMTAKAEDVLETKTFLGEDGSLITGNMLNNGEINNLLSAGESKEILSGYYSGGMITTKTLKDQTQGDAKAEDISNGKIAWVNGEKIIGTNSTSNICFAGSGGSYKNTWTTVNFSVCSLDKNICSLNGTEIKFLRDCKINLTATIFAGRRSDGTVNSGYLRVLINNAVVYTSSGYENAVASFYPLKSYSISSGSTMNIQVCGTDGTSKSHFIIIENVV